MSIMYTARLTAWLCCKDRLLPAAELGKSCAAPAAVVVEADFPDAFRANLYARGLSEDKTADEALGEFKACCAGPAARLLCCAVISSNNHTLLRKSPLQHSGLKE